MTVDILLLYKRVCGGGFGQQGVYALIRVVFRIFLGKSFGSIELDIEKFRVVLLDICQYSRGVVQQIITLFLVKFATDWLGYIDKVKKHQLYVAAETLTKCSYVTWSRDFHKFAKPAQFIAVMQTPDERRVISDTR